jgi:selenocysteine lyase/cysteine desulfurase
MLDLAAIRARIPILRHAVPMNNCSQAPLSDATLAAARAYLDSWNQDGMDWPRWMQEVGEARIEFAGLINASPDEVAVVSSVSHATSVVASALQFDRGRNGVVASAAEFPTVGHVWLAQQPLGAQVHWVHLRDGVVAPEDYEPLVNDRTRVVSAAHGYFLNGTLQDIQSIARLAHGRGALIYVDAYQSIGVVPVDVKAMEVDFLASGTLKFLMGTPGIAFLYVRKELIHQLQPTVTGWFGRVDPFAFDATRLDWNETASRLEAGTPSIFSAYVSRAGMRFLRETGLADVHAWCGDLRRQMEREADRLGLTIHGRAAPFGRTTSTGFVVDDAHGVEGRLRARGILASARGPVVRLAPHFYSTPDDVERALRALHQETRS